MDDLIILSLARLSTIVAGFLFVFVLLFCFSARKRNRAYSDDTN